MRSAPIARWGNSEAGRKKAAPGVEPAAAIRKGTIRRLLDGFVRTIAGVVLRRLDFKASFARKQADEAADGVRLPSRRFHNLGERSALGSLHERDDLGLLVAALGGGACGLSRGPRLSAAFGLVGALGGFRSRIRLRFGCGRRHGGGGRFLSFNRGMRHVSVSPFCRLSPGRSSHSSLERPQDASKFWRSLLK